MQADSKRFSSEPHVFHGAAKADNSRKSPSEAGALFLDHIPRQAGLGFRVEASASASFYDLFNSGLSNDARDSKM